VRGRPVPVPSPQRRSHCAYAAVAAGLHPDLIRFAMQVDAGVFTPGEAIAILDQIQQRMQRLPATIGVRPLTECSCGRNLLPGMRFCDACGAPVSFTGKTERLREVG
jgi:hypothetical protein